MHCVAAGIIQYPILGTVELQGYQKEWDMVMDSPALSLHLFMFNPTYPSRPKRTFATFHEALPITQAHCSSTLLYLISGLLQKTVHTPISVSLLTTYALTLCNQVLLFTLSPSAPRSCDCPWGKSNGLFPMLILTSVSDTTDHFLTSLFPQNTPFSRFSYFSDNSFFLPSCLCS